MAQYTRRNNTSRILVVSRLHFFPRFLEAKNLLILLRVQNTNKSSVRVVGFFLMFRSH